MTEHMGTDRLDLPGVLRVLRRRADLSQRELAARSGVPAATVGHIESGTSGDPRLRTVERLVRATGARLAIVDADGTEPVRLTTDHWRDVAARRFPPHLDPVPQTWWRRGVRHEGHGFRRNRWVRDLFRRQDAGTRRADWSSEIRLLGPADAGMLAILRAEAARLDPGGTPAPAAGPPSGEEALRYLRDPSVRHWIAETTNPNRPDRIGGHLAARVHMHHARPPSIVITDVGVLPEHRDGLVGPLLAAAVCDEAVRLGAAEIVALARDPAGYRYLRSLGFPRHPRPPLLRVPL